ncbi:hypothetical protein [Methylocystis sp. ATCC 49242]|uniref:hypothetical protein n=1 Tax=Methylocystis sp. ATCC 49242 TaxID=622637 RepID=UPI0001F8735A|nr:hypothetical protein [Methylocystis sp. ATCC 49242]
MRLVSAAIFLLAAGLSPACATANLVCEIADKSLNGHLGALMGTLPGLMQVKGEFEIVAKGVPEDFRKVRLTGENLPHSWAHGRELKLHAYMERDKGHFASFELVIDTKATSAGSYRGPYELKVSFTPGEGAGENRVITLRGKASCSLG